MSHLVTGDAVVLELRLATLASRSLAILIDVALQILALVVGLAVLGSLIGTVDDALAAAIALVLTVTILLGYPVAMETLTRGRTVGKLALGLRAVRDDGGAIRFRHALMRGLLGIVEFYATSGVVAVVASLASGRGKRLGDVLAGTVVVRERVPSQPSASLTVPPELVGWATRLDLSRLPDDLALAARQYLARYGQLAPASRHTLGAQLADAVAATVSPPPPAALSAPAYLSAVLAERRRRDLTRLAPPPAVTAADPLPAAPPAHPPPTASPRGGSAPDPFAPPR